MDGTATTSAGATATPMRWAQAGCDLHSVLQQPWCAARTCMSSHPAPRKPACWTMPFNPSPLAALHPHPAGHQGPRQRELLPHRRHCGGGLERGRAPPQGIQVSGGAWGGGNGAAGRGRRRGIRPAAANLAAAAAHDAPTSMPRAHTHMLLCRSQGALSSRRSHLSNHAAQSGHPSTRCRSWEVRSSLITKARGKEADCPAADAIAGGGGAQHARVVLTWLLGCRIKRWLYKARHAALEPLAADRCYLALRFGQLPRTPPTLAPACRCAATLREQAAGIRRQQCRQRVRCRRRACR